MGMNLKKGSKMEVEVYGNIDKAIIELKRAVSRYGITRELRLQSYPKKSERKKAKEALAAKRRRRKEKER